MSFLHKKNMAPLLSFATISASQPLILGWYYSAGISGAGMPGSAPRMLSKSAPFVARHLDPADRMNCWTWPSSFRYNSYGSPCWWISISRGSGRSINAA